MARKTGKASPAAKLPRWADPPHTVIPVKDGGGLKGWRKKEKKFFRNERASGSGKRGRPRKNPVVIDNTPETAVAPLTTTGGIPGPGTQQTRGGNGKRPGKPKTNPTSTELSNQLNRVMFGLLGFILEHIGREALPALTSTLRSNSGGAFMKMVSSVGITTGIYFWAQKRPAGKIRENAKYMALGAAIGSGATIIGGLSSALVQSNPNNRFAATLGNAFGGTIAGSGSNPNVAGLAVRRPSKDAWKSPHSGGALVIDQVSGAGAVAIDRTSAGALVLEYKNDAGNFERVQRRRNEVAALAVNERDVKRGSRQDPRASAARASGMDYRNHSGQMSPAEFELSKQAIDSIIAQYGPGGLAALGRGPMGGPTMTGGESMPRGGMGTNLNAAGLAVRNADGSASSLAVDLPEMDLSDL